MKKFCIPLLLLAIGATMPHPLPAQVAAAFDTARMQRDLDIMEGILDRLLFNQPGHLIRMGGDGAKGIYLPEYGVLFLMPLRFGFTGVRSSAMEQYRQVLEMYQKHQKVTPLPKPSSRSRSYAYQVSRVQEAKEALREFFANYADAIGQIGDTERIAVYATGGDNVFVLFGGGLEVVTGSAADADTRDLLASTQKSDIVAFRTGRLGKNEFDNRVVFREIASAETNSDIDIMTRIIDTALQRRSREPVVWSNGTRGIYLDDYGVIFFTSAAFGQTLSLHFFEDLGKGESPESIERRVLELETSSKRRRENWKVEYNKYKQRLGELIADYGHTLRQLKPQEQIVISANLENPPENGPQQLVFRVKKQHVDAFNARRISREQLIKLISYTEY